MSTVFGRGVHRSLPLSPLSLKKTGASEDEGNPNPLTFPSENDPSAFSTRWDSFPLRDHPVNDTPADGSSFTVRDQMKHMRGMASYLVPRNLLMCSDVLRALGATVVTTIVPLFLTFLVLTTLTLFYMGLSTPLAEVLFEPGQAGSKNAGIQPSRRGKGS